MLVHAGDFTNVGLPREIAEFGEFLERQPHPYKVATAHTDQGWLMLAGRDCWKPRPAL